MARHLVNKNAGFFAKIYAHGKRPKLNELDRMTVSDIGFCRTRYRLLALLLDAAQLSLCLLQFSNFVPPV